MTDTHKDLLDEAQGFVCRHPEGETTFLVCRLIDTIERITASAPVDGDLREKIVEIFERLIARSRNFTVGPDDHNQTEVDFANGRRVEMVKADNGFFMLAIRDGKHQVEYGDLLALLPARTPQPVKDDLFIFVNEDTTINVSEYYRMKGYQKLPPLLTLTGGEIKKIAGYDPAYFVSCDDPWNDFSRDKAVADSEGVPLIAGMRFNIFPPAISKGGENCRPQHPKAEITWAEVHLRYSRRDWSAEVWGAARTPESDADVGALARNRAFDVFGDNPAFQQQRLAFIDGAKFAANLLRAPAVDDGTVTITRQRYEKYIAAEVLLERHTQDAEAAREAWQKIEADRLEHLASTSERCAAALDPHSNEEVGKVWSRLHYIASTLRMISDDLPPAPARGEELILQHASDCAIHNEPAFPKGGCTCGAVEKITLPAQDFDVLQEAIANPPEPNPKLRELLSSPSSPSVEYVLVPREPTKEMLRAYWDCVERLKSSPEFGMIELANARWSAMLTAAPRTAQGYPEAVRAMAKHLLVAPVQQDEESNSDFLLRYAEWLDDIPAHDTTAKAIIDATSLSPQAGVSEWQPIETAPKDGTSVLVYSPDRCSNCTPETTGVFIARWDDKERDWVIGRLVNGWIIRVNHQPTHWQPRPAAPRPASKEAAE